MVLSVSACSGSGTSGGANSGSGSSQATGGQKTNGDGKDAKKEYKPGEVIDYEGVKVVVLSVQRDYYSDDLYRPADEGKEYVGAIVKITNTSDSPVKYNPDPLSHNNRARPPHLVTFRVLGFLPIKFFVP